MVDLEAMKVHRVPGLYAACMRAVERMIGEAVPLDVHRQPLPYWWEELAARIAAEHRDAVVYHTDVDPAGLAVHTSNVRGAEYRIVFLPNVGALTCLPRNAAAIEETTL